MRMSFDDPTTPTCHRNRSGLNPLLQRSAIALISAVVSTLSLAQTPPDTHKTAASEPAPARDASRKTGQEGEATETLKLRYTYGIRLQLSDDANRQVKAKLKPELGFKYGRWSVGTNADFHSWLGAQQAKRDPSVAYDAFTSNKLRLVLGLRLQNLNTGSGFNALESGRLTVRGRVLASYQINPLWNVLGEVTHDLQDRGDGSTLSLGASRLWSLGERDQMSVGASIKWANAEHWRTPYLLNPQTPADKLAQAQRLTSGFGSAGIGWEYRYKLAEQTMLLSSVSASRSIGQLADLNGTRLSISAQLGLLWFGQW